MEILGGLLICTHGKPVHPGTDKGKQKQIICTVYKTWWVRPGYLIGVPYSVGQGSPWRIVRLPLAVSVAGDIQVNTILDILLIFNKEDMML